MFTIAGGVILGVLGLILLALLAPWIVWALRVLFYVPVVIAKLPLAYCRSVATAFNRSSPGVQTFAKVVAIFVLITLSLIGTICFQQPH